MGKIIVLGGGNSSEREVSLRSASAVFEAIKKGGFDSILIDPAKSKEYLDALKGDIIFPILHGEFGEDGELQKHLEDRELAFLGSGSISSKNCFDKSLTRDILIQNGIKMPAGDVVSVENYTQHRLASLPHVAKVLSGGSSIGTFIQRESKPIETKIIEKNFVNEEILIEELIEGVETTVPILDDSSLPVIEIHPPTDGEFDYENKYNGKTNELCPPDSLDESKQNEIQRLAERVHKIMGCRHLSRVDIMIDKKGIPFVLEINTMPGMTYESLFPLSAKTSGITMETLVKLFVELVKSDYSLR